MKIKDVSGKLFMSIFLGVAEGDEGEIRVTLGSKSLFFKFKDKMYQVDFGDLAFEVHRAHKKKDGLGKYRQILFRKGWVIDEAIEGLAQKGGCDEQD